MSDPVKKEMKSGDSIDFAVGDKTLTIGPVPYGNVKRIMRIAFDASKDIASGDLTSMPELIDRNLTTIFPLLFPKGKYDFLSAEWIEDNMTVPTLRAMMEAAVVANGLQDFFDKATGKKAPSGAPLIPETQPAKPGSTTSAGSPTDGSQKT